MRWTYKTVHYEMKKEGLLGNVFFDESAMEQSLNEYGKSGWELVALIETADGLIGILKQPLGMDRWSGGASKKVGASGLNDDDAGPQEVSRLDSARKDIGTAPKKVALVDDYEIVEDIDKRGSDPSRPPADIGKIPIE